MSGGWWGGVARLAVGLGVAGGLVWWRASDVAGLLLRSDVIGSIALGALVHAAQRAVRIAKWRLILRGSGLLEYDFGYLLRAQFLGMLGNLLAPVSEAIKIGVVARNRSDAMVATQSIAVDTATHTAWVGGLGLAAAAAMASHEPWVWGTGTAMALAGVLVSVALWWHRRRRGQPLRLGLSVWVLAGVETLLQIAVYGIAVAALGLAAPLGWLLGISPLLFVGDLVMITPSGLGLREGLFAVVFAHVSGEPDQLGVAVGLVVSSMLLLTTLVGGGLALVWPSGPSDQLAGASEK